MFPHKLKTGKPIDLLSSMKAYIIKNYDSTCFDQKVETFLTEVQQNRNVVCNFNDFSKNMDTLKTNKEILLQYINELNLIKSKMTFGKEDYCVKIEFQWKDTFKSNNWSSFNIALEYYSNLFNLAVIYFNIAKLTAAEAAGDDAKLKESIKCYQYAAGLFDMIKNEIPSSLNAKEIPYDLTVNYMTFCSYICVAFAQVNLLIVAGKKKTGFDLQAQLCKGISDMFGNASNLLGDSLKKYSDDATRSYVSNRKAYYEALAFMKMRDKVLEAFNQTGNDYGTAISYQGAMIEVLQKAEKDGKKIKALLKNDVLDLEKETEKGTEMYDQNQRIYFSPIPEVTTLPKITMKIMANPALPPDYKTNVEIRSELDALIPREVKNMISEYKNKMMDYITQNLNNFENESTCKQFLDQLGLPSSLETILSQSEISDSLWRKINEVQSKGGSMYLTNMLQQLDRKPSEIEKIIGDSLILLQNEQNEDNRLRGQYGSRWNRRPSSDLNGNYLLTLNDYKNKLGLAHNCDQATKNDITNNLRYFELLALPRESLNKKIPKKVDPSAMKNCKEATALREDLDNFDLQTAKCMEVINKIFALLNEDNVAPQFIQVLQKKTTEIAIFDQNKEKFNQMFGELGTITQEIRNLKIGIQAKNEVFLRVKNEQFKPDMQNEEFFRNLDSYCQLFHTKEIQLQQGLNFYKQFDNKLNELNRNITDFLMARDLDKNQLIKSLTSGGSYQENKDNTNINDMGAGYWDFTKNKTSNTSSKLLLFT